MAALLARPSDQERWSYPANLAPLTPAVLTRTTIFARSRSETFWAAADVPVSVATFMKSFTRDGRDRACGFSLS